jgi:hypothetical protein
MRSLFRILLFVVIVPSAFVHAQGSKDAAKPVVVTSPDGRIRAEVFVEKDDGVVVVPRYRISFRGRPVVLSSALGITIYWDHQLVGHSRCVWP